jgi:hypothetical protein
MSLHNLNTPNKQWLMYLNTLSSISGDDLTIKPDTRRNLLLEVSGNNNIFIKKGDISYNLTNLITSSTDASFSNVDIRVNLNPLQTNNSNLGLPSKVWGNAYIRDISVTNMSISGNMTISGTISNVIQIIPRLANDISSSLGSTTNIWQRAFIRDLSNINSINGITWPIIGPTGPTGPAGPTGPTGAVIIGPTGPMGTTTTATWRDISNLRLTTYHRIYQNISGDISGDISWSAVNGYYGLAKDAYPSLNPLSNGNLAVSTWTGRTAPEANSWNSVCWSPQLRIFVAVASSGTNGRIMISPNGINWTLILFTQANLWKSVCWSSELRMFVAVANGGINNNRAMYSYNGSNWTSVTVEACNWHSVCWSSELGIFVAVANTTGSNRVMTSNNGINWSPELGVESSEWYGVCWSPQLKLFVAVGTNRVMSSSNGKNWNAIAAEQNNGWLNVCWSAELGLFVAVSWNGNNRVMTSSNGINWNLRNAAETNNWINVCWSPQLELFVAISDNGVNKVMSSPDGINWTSRASAEAVDWYGICWSPELGIFVSVGNGTIRIMTSSLKGRPPTSYNVFDSSFNRIDENGRWDFSNINVTTLSVTGTFTNTSDDRLKHNEVAITNGLNIIDRLTPKFYQKTQDLLDANYNGDLSNHAWTYEAGLIAQEVLQISDLSFVVGGGDYYEQKYNLITQTQDLSANNYEVSANNYEVTNNYFEPSANNYEVINNLITQAYNLNYNSVFVYGLAAIKELHTKVKAQESTILNQKNIISSLLARIQALEK